MRDKLVMEHVRPMEPTLQQEIGGLGDDDLMDFMNLNSRRTGIQGIVFVSTAMGPHGPRVKYFEKTGKGQPSFSIAIAAEPSVLASSLPERVVSHTAPKVIAWVRLNYEPLLAFWNEGQYWDDDQVTEFKAALKKLPATS
jgi:hypothetical protein